MRRLTFFFFLYTAVSFNVSAHAQVTTSLWQTSKSEHFIVYYQEAPEAYISELINRAEKYYNGIVDNLGYRRFDFWSWDNRAKIYLYRDSSEYLKDTQRSAWSGACVSVKDRTLRTFIGQKGFFDSVLPHEMAHIIFREFVGLKTSLPLWLDEGVACSQEKSVLEERLKTAGNLISRGTYIKLEDLSGVKDDSSLVPQVFYSESASLIVFLLRRYGADTFLDFSRKIRDGVNWKDALMKSYRFENLSEFEVKWREYIVSFDK